LSDGAGMLVGTNAGAVSVVVELDEIGSPPKEHGMTRREHGVDGDQQYFGPLLDGADGGGTPIEVADELGHFAGTINK
jgi:hypothetical protein